MSYQISYNIRIRHLAVLKNKLNVCITLVNTCSTDMSKACHRAYFIVSFYSELWKIPLPREAKPFSSTHLLLQLTYSSSKLSKWSLASSQSASAPVMTTKSGCESWGRGNLISTLNWSMILRMVRPRVPMSRECTRLSTIASTRACPLCDSHKTRCNNTSQLINLSK